MPDTLPSNNPLSYLGVRAERPPEIIRANRAPTLQDTNHTIGDTWIDEAGQKGYILISVSAAGALWDQYSAATGGSIDTLTGDTGGPIAPTGANVNLVGGDLLTVDGSGSTLTLNPTTGGYPITPFVVGLSGEAGYTTIQAALDAANIVGNPAWIFLQPGTYTENLTFPDINITISADPGLLASITGIHTPSLTADLTFDSLVLINATDIVSSAGAGSGTIFLLNCFMVVTDGYVLNLANWTGQLSFDNCGEGGTNDGAVFNTGGSFIKMINTEMGAGSTKVLTSSGGGLARFDTCNVNCPANIAGAGTFLFQNGCKFSNTVTIGGSQSGSCVNSSFLAGSNQALVYDSSSSSFFSETVFDSSNSPAIGGTGSGALSIVGCSFINNAELAGTLTLGSGEVRGAGQISRFVVGEAPDAPYQTIQAALDAAAVVGGPQTVYIQPGTYVENLTFPPEIELKASTADSDQSGVGIVGVHTPPTTAHCSVEGILFTTATDVFLSAAAGAANLSAKGCTFDISGGHIFDVANWTGTLTIEDCNSIGSDDGIINNPSGGAFVLVTHSRIGSETGASAFATSSTTTIQYSLISCAYNASATSFLFHSTFLSPYTLTGSASGRMDFSEINPSGFVTPINVNSTGLLELIKTIIVAEGATAIDGTGSVQLEDVTFAGSSSVVAGTLTVGTLGITRCPVFKMDALEIFEGKTAPTMGVASLFGGTVIIPTTRATATSRIFLSFATISASPGFLSITATTPGVSFAVASTDGADTSSFFWQIIEPA